VAQPWTRTDRLAYWTLVVTVGGGLLVVATQVPRPWTEVCRVAGIVLVVIGIPGGIFLPLLARRRAGANGVGRPEHFTDGVSIEESYPGDVEAANADDADLSSN
jgi:hypothetical protein